MGVAAYRGAVVYGLFDKLAEVGLQQFPHFSALAATLILGPFAVLVNMASSVRERCPEGEMERYTRIVSPHLYSTHSRYPEKPFTQLLYTLSPFAGTMFFVLTRLLYRHTNRN